MSAYISVVCTTNRVGGIDILFDSLSRQIFKDFELIISDNLYQYRKDIISEKAKNVNFLVKHVETLSNPFPINAFSRSANSGLAHADCKLVVFITDYTFLPPESLLKHARLHMTNPELGYMAAHRYFKLNDVHPDFVGYTEEPAQKDNDWLYNHSNEDSIRYAEDVKSGKYNHLMYSLFNKEFNFDNYKLEWDPLLAKADPKAHLTESGPIDGSRFHGKNESCGLENILSVGGWGEYLDGAHGYQDIDLADRLMKFGGIKGWHFDITNGCYIINPRPIFPHGYRMRSVGENKQLWESECAHDYPTKNSWSLKKVNELNKMRYIIDRQLREIEIRNITKEV